MTCENYNCTDANSVEREQERTLTVKNLDHVNYDPAKSDRNVVLEHDNRADQFKTFRAYVKDYKEQEHITGRFNVDTTNDRNATKVLSCFVMSGSHDLMASMTREEQIEYFRAGLDFLKQEYPTFHVVDSRVHYDEKGFPICTLPCCLSTKKKTGANPLMSANTKRARTTLGASKTVSMTI